jgi:putative heme-binding domain-containing protein
MYNALQRARRASMRFLPILIFAASLCAQSQTRNPHTSAADIAAGAMTFRSHCSPCHGFNGEGGRGPDLAIGRFYHGSTDLDLLNNISNGIPGTEMPGLFYSPDRVWQVVAYIRSLNANEKPHGNPAEGAKLFRSKGCPQCHRIDGQGGRLGPDLTLIGEARSPTYLRRALLEPEADVPRRYWVVECRDAAGKSYQGFLMNEDTYTVQFIDMHERLHSLAKAELKDYRVKKISKMPSFKDVLQGAEADDLVAFLASLRRPGGAQ